MTIKVKKMKIILFSFIIPFNDLKISMFCKVQLPTNLCFSRLVYIKDIEKVF